MAKTKLQHLSASGHLATRVTEHPYTHVVIGVFPTKDTGGRLNMIHEACTWHKSLANAQRAQSSAQYARDTYVEAVNGGTR